MGHTLSIASFIIFFSVIGIFHTERKAYNTRFPSQVTLNCYENTKAFLSFNNPKSSLSLWRRVLGFPQNRFDQEKYLEFLLRHEEDSLESMEPFEESVEGILAFSRAHVLKTMDSQQVKILGELKLNRFREAALERIVERMKKRGMFETGQIEDLTRELYLTAYGPEFKWRHIFSRSKALDGFILRVVEQDLATRGLMRVFKDYRYSSSRPSFLQKFANSLYGKSLMTGIFNLPVYLGLPPLYLPSGRPFILSEGLAYEILEKGLNPETLRKVDMELGSFSFDKARYEVLKRYYVKGVMIYLTFAGFYDFYQLNKELDDQGEVLDDATKEASGILDSAARLERSGISVFKDNQDVEGKSFCDAILNCLKSVGLNTENIDVTGDYFRTCVQLTDPSSRCKKW